MSLDGKIDYSAYSSRQLSEAWQSIDRDAFPLNFANLRRELELRAPQVMHPPTPEAIEQERRETLARAAGLHEPQLEDALKRWKNPPEGSTFNRLRFVRDTVATLPSLTDVKPSFEDGSRAFTGRLGYALRLMFTEGELIVFGILQWVAIALGYYLWVQMLFWIPEEVWRSARESNGSSPADLVVYLWSLLCVGIVALPLGLLSACCGTAAILRKSGARSSIAACLRLASPQVLRFWIFTWIDGWITVLRILDRLPGGGRKSLAERARDETLYYAWKLGTAGVLPALVMGKSLGRAGIESIKLLRHRLKDVMSLRAGYSSFCWLVGIGAYLGTIAFFRYFDQLLPRGEPIERHIGEFYVWAGIPIMVAAGVVIMFLRPVYLISLSALYVEHLHALGEKPDIPSAPSRIVESLVALAVMATVVLVIVLYRDELGISRMLAVPFG